MVLASAAEIPIAWVAPFVTLLLAIAILPLWKPHFWEHNRNKALVALVLGVPVGIWCLVEMPGVLLHTGIDYVAFIVLLGSLFTVSGGIFLEGDLRALPRVNTSFLALGAVLASLIGTTGASMVLIRPLIRTNGQRKHVTHTVVFFIFVVSNVGGCLTPLGDPPLFLGYLKGVPFEWTFTLWKEWLFVNAILLAVYYAWDSRAIRKETPQALRMDLVRYEPLRVRGLPNVLMLGGVVLAVAFLPMPWRELVMVALAVASYKLTPRAIHERNAFAWGPILEVAILFAGIFTTMIPALHLLEAKGGSLGVREPWQFFWASGSLSSFLDNAPTYLTFASVAVGLLNSTVPGANLSAEQLGGLLDVAGGAALLTAVSLGSVFMGANTYIGNGPNFMVKAIAEQRGVKMPSFFGYMAYSVGILIPIFVAVTFLFLV